jgi:hypothetical protein
VNANKIAMDEPIRRNHLKKVPHAERLPGGILILVLATFSNVETAAQTISGEPLTRYLQ